MAFLRRLIASLSRDTRGNVLAIVGAALVPLVIMIGSGIDLSRAYMAKAKMQSACDAASLAARQVLKDDTLDESVTETAEQFFHFNYPKGVYGSSEVTPLVSKPAAGVIRVVAEGDVPTSIMRMFGYDTLPVAVNCDAELSFVNTDITLVLDVTGSMDDSLDGTKKIVSMREAVLALYDELTPIQTQLQSQGLRLRYSVVPYSSTVNVGRLLYSANPNNISSTANISSRVANFYDTAYAPKEPTSQGAWQYASGTSSKESCKNWVGEDSESQGTPPNPTTVTRYQGTASSTGFERSQNWGWSGAPDTSGPDRSCRRWKIVETTEYEERRALSSWTYRNVSYTLGDFVKSGGSVAYAKTGEGTTPLPGRSYDLIELANAVTDGNIATATWNGCIQARKTNRTAIDGGTSLSIPSDAYDLDIDRLPTSEDTRWQPMVPELAYRRVAGATSNTWATSATSEYAALMADYTYESGYYSCPAEARRLTEWSRGGLETYLNGLQANGGTYLDVGMIWGGRFSSTGGVFGDGCDFYNSMPCNRHIIFMTDGFQTAYCNVYSAYGIERNDMRVKGSTNCTSDNSSTSAVTAQLVERHEQRFRMACNAAKATGASLWVIGFDTALSTDLANCASSTNQASTVGDRAALIARFREIGNQIGALRLTR